MLLGVVSNKRGYLLRREAAHLGWMSLFHRLVGANDAP
jgi:phosphoglycolate phosphatase